MNGDENGRPLGCANVGSGFRGLDGYDTTTLRSAGLWLARVQSQPSAIRLG